MFFYFVNEQTKNIPIEDVNCGYPEDIRESINNVNTSGAFVFYTANCSYAVEGFVGKLFLRPVSAYPKVFNGLTH